MNGGFSVAKGFGFRRLCGWVPVVRRVVSVFKIVGARQAHRYTIHIQLCCGVAINAFCHQLVGSA